MVSCPRRKLLGKNRKGIYHCWSRCVRRANLLSESKSDRRRWIICREEQLASLFAIDIEFRAEMRNHLHLILRTRPEIVRRWSDEEVLRRWLTITKLAKCMSDAMPQPDPKRFEELLKDKKYIKRVRKRLSSVSWFMGTLCENIARRANKEDDCKGHFWESRYQCRECSDVGALLICGIYVDLNAMRAGEASSPETSVYTSIYSRLQAKKRRKNARNREDGWMAELTLRPECKEDEEWAYKSRTGRRASDLGVLPISLDSYLELLKWTARELQSGERQTIPKHLESILERMEIDHEQWLDTIADYQQAFCHVVGSPKSLNEAAGRMNAQFLKGATASRRAYLK
jgi:hypothetical protein